MSGVAERYDHLPRLRDLERRSFEACRSYEHWASEVTRLTGEIGECRCPNEPGPHRDDEPEGFDAGEWEEYSAGRSCFATVRERMVRAGPAPDDGPRPLRLEEVAEAVSDCPACSRLCELIAERKHARQRFGVAKRAIRHVGKKAPEVTDA